MRHYDAGAAPLGDAYRQARGAVAVAIERLSAVAEIFAEMGDHVGAEKVASIALSLEGLLPRVRELEPAVDGLLDPYAQKRRSESAAANAAKAAAEKADRLRVMEKMVADSADPWRVPGALRFRK